MEEQDNIATLREFIAAWSRLDPEELVGYFAEDGIYHNMPIDPVQGHHALRQFIAAFLHGWSKTQWDVLSIAASGNTVFVERLDRTIVNGKPVSLPCCGVFEMKDGKVAVWRDYFDMATYRQAVGD
ncbi:limonene-1,2-epoxide hydrolase [Erythrobacter longus]|uniref:Limonene-1,2-epoxide hydrolase n=1 Tax=Erythrobacter longus TaxID=1044 RepID=A0A074MAC2_ERYLO|nr:limonene-1,2-epoxide hydrolase family protein [Erythrobacter longus]KEO89685.1 limonene-1,2-epoxide hydrolase [Erythrobacter longus]